MHRRHLLKLGAATAATPADKRLINENPAAPDTRAHGLGDVRKELVTEQIAMVADTFGLKTRPTMDSLYDLRFLPPLADRRVKV